MYQLQNLKDIHNHMLFLYVVFSAKSNGIVFVVRFA